MLTIARQRLEKDSEDGFTLIEPMVVVLIIAILMAIAIPSFLSAQDRANDRSAQSNMRVGLTNARSIYTDTQKYPGPAHLKVLLNNAEPNIAFVALADAATVPTAKVDTVAAAAASGAIPAELAKVGEKPAVHVFSTDAAVTFKAVSKSGKCFQLVDSAGTTSDIAPCA